MQDVLQLLWRHCKVNGMTCSWDEMVVVVLKCGLDLSPDSLFGNFSAIRCYSKAMLSRFCKCTLSVWLDMFSMHVPKYVVPLCYPSLHVVISLSGYKFDEADHESYALRLTFARHPGPRGPVRDEPFRGGRDRGDDYRPRGGGARR